MLKREDYWMKTPRTIYSYSLNERAKEHDSEVPVRKLFFSIPRTKQRSARYRNNNDYLKNDTMTEILQTFITSFKTILKTLSIKFV